MIPSPVFLNETRAVLDVRLVLLWGSFVHLSRGGILQGSTQYRRVSALSGSVVPSSEFLWALRLEGVNLPTVTLAVCPPCLPPSCKVFGFGLAFKTGSGTSRGMHVK